MSDFKQAPRIKDPALLRALKYEYDACEITGETFDLHLHHVIYRGHTGDDVRENLVCLVRWLHEGVHAGNELAKLALARHIRDRRKDVAKYIALKLGGEDQLLGWYERYGLQKGERSVTP